MDNDQIRMHVALTRLESMLRAWKYDVTSCGQVDLCRGTVWANVRFRTWIGAVPRADAIRRKLLKMGMDCGVSLTYWAGDLEKGRGPIVLVTYSLDRG